MIGRLQSGPGIRTPEDKKTGLFPIMHLIGIKKTLVERYPWLATSGVPGSEGAGDDRSLRCQRPDGHLALARGRDTPCARG
jgi:hypothetical protein